MSTYSAPDSTDFQPGPFPPGWEVERLADGWVRIYQTGKVKPSYGCSGFLAVLWCIATSLLLAPLLYALVQSMLSLYPSPYSSSSRGDDAGGLLMAIYALAWMSPFVLVGVFFAYTFFWGRYGTEDVVD